MPLGYSSTSATSTDSPTATSSPPGTAPHPWMPPPENRNATDSPAPQPTDQPSAAHHGGRPAAQPHRRADLLRCQEGRRQDTHGGHPRPQTTAVQHRVRTDARRPETTRSDRPGRALGDDSAIQRDRPDPGRRLFGQGAGLGYGPHRPGRECCSGRRRTPGGGPTSPPAAAGAAGPGRGDPFSDGNSRAPPWKGLKTTLPIAPPDLTGPIPLEPESQGGQGGSLASSAWLGPDSVGVSSDGKDRTRCAAGMSQSLAWRS
jgi:hypothetical protein